MAGAAFALAADQLSKSWCDAHLRLYQSQSLFAGLSLTRNPNRGLAYGHFSNLPPGHIDTYIRYIPTVVLACLAAMTAWRWREADKIERLGWSLSLAGGLSNLWSHWTSVEVLDTLSLPTGLGWNIVFNIADASLCAGAVLVLFALARSQKTSR